ncbi:hypothetical protein FW774_11485 [Pedobacter sp. BS3]|uniref:hypothetical protein n=1 Tax=Pedobacter sp. BS3 TaxID=2567937 RepID=UPI0011ED17D4|nr:hypothetical protein [Pedobacter sp. BS3]TZF84058.1 hypothetical protein FW774_11485 [Pedobacter sp. BS3]
MAAKKKPNEQIILQQEIAFSVAGKDEKDHTLSWEILKKIGDNTQRLIDVLMKYANTKDKISPDLTKLVFTGFYPGSAQPAWRIKELPNLLFPLDDEMKELNHDFNFVIQNINKGNFKAIADKYDIPEIRNEVIDAVYSFSNSAGTKPFTIIKRLPDGKQQYKSIAKVRRMDITHKNELYAKTPKENLKNNERIEVFASLKVSSLESKKPKFYKKDLHLYTEKETTLAVRLEYIETEHRIYHLRSEIPFTLNKVDKSAYTIDSPLLDIYAYGNSIKEAEEDFYSQFDYTYQRIAGLPDKQLSEHLQRAKQFILLLVDNVKNK